MAGHARYTAILDACVLYPVAITDALLSLAAAGLYAAKWTTKIEEEWMRALAARRPELAGKLDARRDAMRDATPDWEVPEAAWSAVMQGLELPDENDRHVLAAAIAGHADGIVTANIRHFPENRLREFRLEAITPDDFIISQWDLDPAAAIDAFGRMRARRRSPEMGPAEFADALKAGGLPLTARRLRAAAELI